MISESFKKVLGIENLFSLVSKAQVSSVLLKVAKMEFSAKIFCAFWVVYHNFSTLYTSILNSILAPVARLLLFPF